MSLTRNPALNLLKSWLWFNKIILIVLSILHTSSLHASSQAALFFATSGQTVRVPTVTQLRFLGARIPSVSSGVFKLPQLRAPGIMKAYNSSGEKVMEFVVYPNSQETTSTKAASDKPKPIAAKLLGPPVWFEQWADATRFFAETETKTKTETETETKTSCLLIVGPDAAGESPQTVLGLMKQQKLKTALVFSPHWSGPVRSESTSLTLAQAKGSLLQDYQALGNPAPLNFSHFQTPCPMIVNRLCWLSPVNEPFHVKAPDLKTPYVEAILLAPKSHIIVSYIPWQEMLGRHEQADSFFCHLLTKAAKAPEIRKTSGDLSATLQLQWPRHWDVRATERPILHHLLERQARLDPTPTLKQASRVEASKLHLVDLRGKPVQRAKHPQLRKALTYRPLLILGVDPKIQEAEIKGDDVIWLKEDTFPKDAASAYELMEILTQLNIAL